jgi:hypothetical protein
MQTRIKAYFSLPADQRQAELDRQIKQEELFRKAWEASRPAGGGGADRRVALRPTVGRVEQVAVVAQVVQVAEREERVAGRAAVDRAGPAVADRPAVVLKRTATAGERT